MPGGETVRDTDHGELSDTEPDLSTRVVSETSRRLKERRLSVSFRPV